MTSKVVYRWIVEARSRPKTQARCMCGTRAEARSVAHAINRDPRIALRYVVRRLNFPVYRSLADTPWLNPGEEP